MAFALCHQWVKRGIKADDNIGLGTYFKKNIWQPSAAQISSFLLLLFFLLQAQAVGGGSLNEVGRGILCETVLLLTYPTSHWHC